MKRIKPFEHEIVKGVAFGSSPFGEPSLYVYIWFIDGLLIDTGHRHMRKEILATIGDWPIEQLYITHHHEDHSANIRVIKEQHACRVLTSTACADIMKHPPSISPAQHMSWGMYEPYTTFTIEEQRVATSNYVFDIHPIPGHATDMVCLHEPDQGWLFSADLYLNYYIKYFMRGESMKAQINSLKLVLQLDFDTMFCAHNPQLKEPKSLLSKKLQFLEDFYGNVNRRVTRGYGEKEIFADMGLKEAMKVKLMSLGKLSTMNMVRSVIRDVKDD